MHIPYVQPYSYPGLNPDALRQRCDYTPPPAELTLPEYDRDKDGAAYRRLFGHFRAESGGDFETAYDKMTVYIALENGLQLEEAESLLWDYEGNQPMSYN